MNNPIMFSTGVFINSGSGHDHSALIKLMPELPVPRFELLVSDYFANRQDEYEEAAKNVLLAKKKGACFPVMHMNQMIGTLISRNEPEDIENAMQIFEFNCQYAAKFGVKLLVLHLWGGTESDKHIDINIEIFPKLKVMADGYNLMLTIENVVCNTHRPLENMKRLWDLYQNNVKFTIDVRHAEFHKSLAETCETHFLWENNLVRHVHISDYSGGYMEWPKFLGNNTPITFGDVDFGYFFSFLKSIGYTGSITIENNRISESGDLAYNFNTAYRFVENGLKT